MIGEPIKQSVILIGEPTKQSVKLIGEPIKGPARHCETERRTASHEVASDCTAASSVMSSMRLVQDTSCAHAGDQLRARPGTQEPRNPRSRTHCGLRRQQGETSGGAVRGAGLPGLMVSSPINCADRSIGPPITRHNTALGGRLAPLGGLR